MILMLLAVRIQMQFGLFFPKIYVAFDFYLIDILLLKKWIPKSKALKYQIHMI